MQVTPGNFPIFWVWCGSCMPGGLSGQGDRVTLGGGVGGLWCCGIRLHLVTLARMHDVTTQSAYDPSGAGGNV